MSDVVACSPTGSPPPPGVTTPPGSPGGEPRSPPGDPSLPSADDPVVVAAASELPPPPDFHDAKLFVGLSGWSADDEQVKSLMETYGKVEECYVMKAKGGASKGCAFVRYADKSNGNVAIAALNGKVNMPGGQALMVKWADRKPQADDRKPEPPTPPPSERRLFMGLSSWTATDEDVMQLVQQFGDVEEAYVMKAKGGTSKGCALVKFKDKAAGQRCIDELHEKHTFEGAERPIIVKWADPPKAQQPQPPMPMHNAASQPVLTLVQQQALLQQGILLGQQMALQQQQQAAAHQQWGYAPPTAPQAAYAAYAQPNQPPYETPVVTDPYAAYYQQAAAHQDPYTAYYQQQAAAAAAAQAMQAWTGQAAQPQHQSAWATAAPPATPSSGNPRSIVPEGCSVFVYHVPPYWTDDNMKEQFLAYGNIVTAVVAKDKTTGLPKGYGFVNYDNPASASAAVQAMNGLQVDGTHRLSCNVKLAIHSRGARANPY